MQSKKRESLCTKGCTESRTSTGVGLGITILKKPAFNRPGCETKLGATSLKEKTDKSSNFTIKPLHTRIQEYYKARERIFGEKERNSRSAKRMRLFWKNVHNMRKQFVCSVFNRSSDVRPYAEVTLFGKKMLGLMDTGASVCCLGGKAAEEFLDSGRPYKNINSSVKTADGTSQNVVGFVKETITFRGTDKIMTIFLIPSLDKELFLAIDFWDAIDLLNQG